MIEGVFGEDAQADIPEALAAASRTVEGKDWAAANIAASNRLDLATGYSRGDSGEWSNDAEAPQAMGLDDWSGDAGATRLGEPTTYVRLGRWQDGTLTPWHVDGWEASSLRMASRVVKLSVLNEPQSAAVERTIAALPDRGRWSVQLPLTLAAEGDWRGASKDSQERIRHWRYDASSGLREVSSSSEGKRP